MDPRFWAIVFIVLMIVCLFLELMTPTMGLFTLLAVGCSVGSVYAGFKSSEAFGYLMIAANLFTFPVALYYIVMFLKKSPLIHSQELNTSTQNAPDARPMTGLIGQHGQAITPLRPAGAAMIGERRVDVVTEGKFVETGSPVKVIRVEGNKVFVEPLAS